MLTMSTMMKTSLVFLHLILLCLYQRAKSASIVSHPTPDGFWLEDMMPGRTFSYGVVSQRRGQEMSLAFYDVNFSSKDCDVIRVDVYDDGYVKADFNRIAILCDQESLREFTAVSEKGFHVVVTMGTAVDGGSLKARFRGNGGIKVTNEVLYG